MNTNLSPLLRGRIIKKKQCGEKRNTELCENDPFFKNMTLKSWKLYLNVVVQHFIHSAVLADNPAPRSTLSRWHGVALEDSIFNPLGTGSAKQEVERMLRVRRQSGHFRLARCRMGHKSVPHKYAYRAEREKCIGVSPYKGLTDI